VKKFLRQKQIFAKCFTPNFFTPIFKNVFLGFSGIIGIKIFWPKKVSFLGSIKLLIGSWRKKIWRKK